jgi:hypothetical protein
VPRIPTQLHQIPANANSGRSSASANHVQRFRPVDGSGPSVGSQSDVAGTRQRNSGFINARQWAELTLRMFVTSRQSGSPRTAPKHHDLDRRQRRLRGGLVPSVPPIRVRLALPVVCAFCRPLSDPGFCRGFGFEVRDHIWNATPLSYLNGIA